MPELGYVDPRGADATGRDAVLVAVEVGEVGVCCQAPAACRWCASASECPSPVASVLRMPKGLGGLSS